MMQLARSSQVKMRSKSGQVWIETVVYTLIGLSLIAVVLAIVTPKINEYKDKSVIEQTISSLNEMDSKIKESLAGGVGNARTVEFRMKRGEIYFDRERDIIYYIMDDSDVLYSEPDVETSIGRVKILTQEGQKKNTVKLTIEYQQNITFEGVEDIIIFTPSSVPYKFRFENGGFSPEGRQIVNFEKI